MLTWGTNKREDTHSDLCRAEQVGETDVLGLCYARQEGQRTDTTCAAGKFLHIDQKSQCEDLSEPVFMSNRQVRSRRETRSLRIESHSGLSSYGTDKLPLSPTDIDSLVLHKS